MKRFVQILLLAFVVLAGVVMYRGLTLESARETPPAPVEVRVDPAAPARLAGALRYPTISPADSADFRPEPFLSFHEYLRETYPRFHEALDRELVGGFSLLYTWAGSDPNLRPAILMAHMDVVPLEPGTEAEWTHPPFAGARADGAVWGRGAMDDKASLLAIVEAIEALLEAGYRPQRTLIFSFGHDEEIGGGKGAAAVAALLRDRGVRAEYVLDEGMAIVEGTLPGVQGPVALIGLAEKGYLSVELTVDVEGGHSSTPPAHTAVGILSGAVTRLEANPMPARLDGPSRLLLETLAPDMPFGMRVVMANLWLFEGLVTRLMSDSPETDAAIRTTTAPTLLRAGIKDNILPSQAQAVVNFRILPGDTGEDVLDHVRRTVDDARVKVVKFGGVSTEPSSVSRVGSWGYGEIGAAVQEVFPGTIVAPFLTLGGTDSKHFVGVADEVYRFAPIRYRPELASGVHGTDERIPEEDYLGMVSFYRRLLERSGG